MTHLTECPNCHSKNIETIDFEHWHCKDCGKKYHLSYYCKNCNQQITKSQYEDQEGLCDSCFDSKEDSEGDGLMSGGDIIFPPED